MLPLLSYGCPLIPQSEYPKAAFSKGTWTTVTWITETLHRHNQYNFLFWIHSYLMPVLKILTGRFNPEFQTQLLLLLFFPTNYSSSACWSHFSHSMLNFYPEIVSSATKIFASHKAAVTFLGAQGTGSYLRPQDREFQCGLKWKYVHTAAHLQWTPGRSFFSRWHTLWALVPVHICKE